MMGKQLSIYLNDEETKRLNSIAAQEYRHPREQARYLLRLALLGSPAPVNDNSDSVPTYQGQDTIAVAQSPI